MQIAATTMLCGAVPRFVGRLSALDGIGSVMYQRLGARIKAEDDADAPEAIYEERRSIA